PAAQQVLRAQIAAHPRPLPFVDEVWIVWKPGRLQTSAIPGQTILCVYVVHRARDRPDSSASVLVKMLNHRLCRQHVINGDVTDLIGKLERTLDHHERRSTLQQLMYQRVMGTSRSDDQAIHQTVLLQDALKELLFVFRSEER